MYKPARSTLGMTAIAFVLALPAAAQAAPDLEPVFRSISPDPAAANSNVSVSINLRNQGAGAANLNQTRANGTVIHMMRWYFKENGNGPDRFILAMSMLGTLNAGQSRTLTNNLRIPADAKPGVHAICAESDPENRVRESNERNNRSCIRVRVRGLSTGGPGPGRATGGYPDLVIRSLSTGPATFAPGAGVSIEALIRNVGTAVAPGTTSGKGFMVDITIGTDTNVPSGFATYSPNYAEDVLLKGGRFSNTTDLPPGTMSAYSETANRIPSDTPPGKYFICARVDPGSTVAESSEINNTRCKAITVALRSPTPDRPSRLPGTAAKCPGPLPAPRHISPRNGSKFNSFPRTTRFRWAAVSNTRSYGIEVDCLHCCVQGEWCSDVGKRWHVKNGLTAPEYTHNFVGAQPGRWRVWAVDACGRKGKASGWWKFEYTR